MRFAVLILSLWLGAAAGPLVAENRPVLRVIGATLEAPATFTMDELHALPATQIETSTVVTDGVHSFTGVLLRDLLADLGTDYDGVTATALNDYVVDIPRRDLERFDVILGYRMDGHALDRADKGPLWIVYPRDAHRELQDIRYDYRWVWQLSELELK